MKVLKYAIATAIIAITVAASCIYTANYSIDKSSKDYISGDPDMLPSVNTALVLGTAKYLKYGSQNPYFKYRIEATAELYKAGKIKYIIVSGDNSVRNYNEPLDMKNDLVAAGVPKEVIYLDYAGFRTLDSVVRMKEIFSQTRFIVVSQEFHNSRAVYIGRKRGYDVYGYNAKEVTGRAGVKTNLREKLARVKVFIDELTGKKPKFLGEKIHIGTDPANDL